MRIGYNIESKPSRWIGLMGILDKVISWGQSKGIKLFSSPDVVNIQKMYGMPIIAPSSLAAQAYVNRHYDLQMPFTSIQERTQADFVSHRATRSKRYAEITERVLPRSTYQRFASTDLDYTEVLAFAHMVDKATNVRKGTIGFDPIRNSIAWIRAAQDSKSQDLFRQLVEAAYKDVTVTVEPMTPIRAQQPQRSEPAARSGGRGDNGKTASGAVRCAGSYGP
jgi:hypothetical protein